MKQITVGIREFKGHLSRYLREVRTGATLVLTDRGEPIGWLVPVTSSVEDKLRNLVAGRQLLWSGHKLAASSPRAEPLGATMVSDLVVQGRE
jgi:prevent-host-death family protein